MKTVRTKSRSTLTLRLRSFGSYVDEIYKLEAMLGRKPKRLRIEMVGSGEIPPDSALLIRSILLGRSARTHVTIRARSSLQGPAVLVWLMGDTRLIREDAQLYLRPAGPFENAAAGKPAWKDRGLFDDDDLEEADYIRVLQSINEFLPVKELAGHPIDLPILRQFALVDNEDVDRILAAAFRKESQPGEKPPLKARKRLSDRPDVSI